MGSNSLLEALVLGRIAAECAADCAAPYSVSDVDFPAGDRDRPQDTRLSVEDMIYSLKSLMWRQMGIIRDGPSLADALKRIAFWTGALRELAPPERRAFELINMLTVARLATISAQARPESRGVHYRSDFPETEQRLQVNTVLTPVFDGAVIESVEVRHEPIAASVPAS
jgi:L-aspartate oxidase